MWASFRHPTYQIVLSAQGSGLGGDIFGGQQPEHQGSPGMISMASPVKPQQMGHPGVHGGKGAPVKSS